MSNIGDLENLPQIDLLEEEGISFEAILNEMIASYESHWEELTGEKLTLYPADSRRILLNVTAGKLYQLATIINERHKLNFLQYMYGDFLKNWGSNFGFKEDGVESATVVLRFHILSAQSGDILIPAGTRVTSGDRIFFATNEDFVIPAGETYADTGATCTQRGIIGNGYVIGQLNIIADPVNLVDRAENITVSAGGHDEYTDQELRELIYNFPSTYSTAGPKDCYEEIVKQYSSNIVDVRVITDYEAIVSIYILLRNGVIPDEEYCNSVSAHLMEKQVTPDTDKIQILPPAVIPYTLEAVYYISNDRKDIADNLKESIEDAAASWVVYTRNKIGRAINPDTLVSYVMAAGASRIEITAPAYSKVLPNEVALCSETKLIFGGLE